MDEDLKNLAELALAQALRELTKHGTMVPTFIVREEDGETIAVVRLEGQAGQLMNSGQAKDILFGGMRTMVKERNLTAVVFVSEGWMGKQTPKGAALSEGEFLRRSRERGFASALKDGLIERTDVISVTAQTPKGMRIVHQEFMRDYKGRTIVYGERHEQEVGPDEFSGRQKMYGNLSEEFLG